MGLCSQCGKPFSPKGSDTYKLLKMLSVVAGVIFGFFAFLTLVVILLDGEGIVWLLALIFGAIWCAIQFGKKKIQAQMDECGCPHCGKNKKGETVFTPAEPKADPIETPAAAPVETQADAVTETKREFVGKGKTCPSCRAQNPMISKTCVECGCSFGKTIKVTDGKQTFGVRTCPGCGSVSKLKKNVLFIVIMLLLGSVLFGIGMGLLGLVLALCCYALALLHLCGKLMIFSSRRCTTCKKTPFGIAVRNAWSVTSEKNTQRATSAQIKYDQNLLRRANTPFMRASVSLSRRFKATKLLAFGTMLATVLFGVMIFFPGEYKLSLGGRDDMLFGDYLLNFGDESLKVLMIVCPVLLFLTNVLTFSSAARLKGVSLVMGVLAGISEIVFTALSLSVEKAEFEPMGTPTACLVISTLLVIAMVFIGYMAENGKRCRALTCPEETE